MANKMQVVEQAMEQLEKEQRSRSERHAAPKKQAEDGNPRPNAGTRGPGTRRRAPKPPTSFSIAKFHGFCRKLVHDLGYGEIMIGKNPAKILQAAAKQMLESMFAQCAELAEHAGRETVLPQDIVRWRRFISQDDRFSNTDIVKRARQKRRVYLRLQSVCTNQSGRKSDSPSL